MTACPACNRPGEHVQVVLPLKPVAGAQVIHECHRHGDQPLRWTVHVREPLTLARKALAIQQLINGTRAA